jgi:hypothetical protein
MSGQYVFKVSKAGKDVKTATDDDLIIRDDYTVLKVAFHGEVTLGDANWAEVTHNLGYVPQFLVYVEDSVNDDNMRLATGDYPAGIQTFPSGIARADTTKVYFKGTTGAKVYYYIFHDLA